MTTEQRERIAREILRWELTTGAEGFCLVANEVPYHSQAGVAVRLPLSDDPRWLYPLLSVLLLLGWHPKTPNSHLYLIDPRWCLYRRKLPVHYVHEDTLADAVNAAALIQIGEGE